MRRQAVGAALIILAALAVASCAAALVMQLLAGGW